MQLRNNVNDEPRFHQHIPYSDTFIFKQQPGDHRVLLWKQYLCRINRCRHHCRWVYDNFFGRNAHHGNSHSGRLLGTTRGFGG